MHNFDMVIFGSLLESLFELALLTNRWFMIEKD